MTKLETMMQEINHHASITVNEQLGQPYWKDQSAGNQCHALTRHALIAMEYRGIPVRRELHRDRENWHYILAHTPEGTEPSDDDMITDFNPWQFYSLDRNRFTGIGKGMLHMPRAELMHKLEAEGAPDFFVALRSIQTIVKSHEPKLNFGGHIDS